MTLVIDCHGHYTTVPAGHADWREAQKAAFKTGTLPPPYPALSDDEISRDPRGEPDPADPRPRRGHDHLQPQGVRHGAACRRRGGRDRLGTGE